MSSHFIIHDTAFALVNKTVYIGNQKISFGTIPYDPIELERIVNLCGLSETSWPYWLEEWPAVYGLAEILGQDLSALLAQKNLWKEGSEPLPKWGSILDLGCGSGFLAAFMKQGFGIEIFSCDFNFDACRLAALNTNFLETKNHHKTFCSDFNSFPTHAKFQIILAGEMLYTKQNHLPILNFLKTHLTMDGIAYFADPGRSAAEGFKTLAEQFGFSVEITATLVEALELKVNVYKLHPKIFTI